MNAARGGGTGKDGKKRYSHTEREKGTYGGDPPVLEVDKPIGPPPDPWNYCPLCTETIKVTFPSEINGQEVEKYWAWVNESVPYIPPNFVKGFHKRSTAEITRKVKTGTVLYDLGGGEVELAGVEKKGTGVCSIS